MEIRAFCEADENAVIALWTEVFGYAEPHNHPAKAIRDKLAVQRELFLVALVEGKLAGTVMGGYDGHRGWIYSLAVAPDLRRRGIGAALLRHVERGLAALGCSKVNLQVLEANAATIDFYERLGYNVEKRVTLGKLLTPIGAAQDRFP